MKFLNYEFLTIGEENEFENIYLFKKVAISPKNKDFLRSKITIKNYCIMSIQSGQFEWKLDGETFKIRPNDLILVSPGMEMEKDFENVEFGGFYKISLDAGYYKMKEKNKENTAIDSREIQTIFSKFDLKKFLIFRNHKEAFEIFEKLEEEFLYKELGYYARINALIDELIITIYRNTLKEEITIDDNSTEFQKLTVMLKNNLAHHWTVKEMAELSGMGVTNFTEKLKNNLGFSPFDYLIFLRINEAARLLKESDFNLTQIAFDTGFYSSQHFSNTFKKIMGYPPRDFRKNAVA